MKLAIAIMTCLACYNVLRAEDMDTHSPVEGDSDVVDRCVAQAVEYLNAESWYGAKPNDAISDARAAVAEVVEDIDMTNRENRQELIKAIRVAQARAAMYEMVTEELCRVAIRKDVSESYPTLVDVGLRTQHHRVASLILVWLKDHDVEGRVRVLDRWVRPYLIHPDWLAAVITQGLAGEDWGLKWSRPEEQPVDRAKRQAYEYLQERHEGVE